MSLFKTFKYTPLLCKLILISLGRHRPSMIYTTLILGHISHSSPCSNHAELLEVCPAHTGYFMHQGLCFICSLCLEATPPLLPPVWETPTQLSRCSSVIAYPKNSLLALLLKLAISSFCPTDPCAVSSQSTCGT